jgi:hypothetical protein
MMMKGDILWKKSKMIMKGVFLGKKPMMKKSLLGKKHSLRRRRIFLRYGIRIMINDLI